MLFIPGSVFYSIDRCIESINSLIVLGVAVTQAVVLLSTTIRVDPG